MWGEFQIREEMPVCGCCGGRPGTVAGVGAGPILVRGDHGDRPVPLCRVDGAGQSVRLSRPCGVVKGARGEAPARRVH